jgi:hypothetical protein
MARRRMSAPTFRTVVRRSGGARNMTGGRGTLTNRQGTVGGRMKAGEVAPPIRSNSMGMKGYKGPKMSPRGKLQGNMPNMDKYCTEPPPSARGRMRNVVGQRKG